MCEGQGPGALLTPIASDFGSSPGAAHRCQCKSARPSDPDLRYSGGAAESPESVGSAGSVRLGAWCRRLRGRRRLRDRRQRGVSSVPGDDIGGHRRLRIRRCRSWQQLPQRRRGPTGGWRACTGPEDGGAIGCPALGGRGGGAAVSVHRPLRSPAPSASRRWTTRSPAATSAFATVVPVMITAGRRLPQDWRT